MLFPCKQPFMKVSDDNANLLFVFVLYTLCVVVPHLTPSTCPPTGGQVEGVRCGASKI